MKNTLSQLGCTALVLATAAFAGIHPAQAQNTINNLLNTINLQGVMEVPDFGCGPADGPCPGRIIDIKTILVPRCGQLSCPPRELGTNTVTLGKGGLFNMPLVIPQEFLANLEGADLQFAVRTNGGGEFTSLSGTIPLTATPFATVAQSVLGPISASNLTGQMPTGMLTGIFSSPLSLSNPANVFVGNGALLANVNAATLGGYTPCNLPCFWKLTGNDNATASSFIGTPTGNNNWFEMRVNGNRALRLIPNETSPNILGGSPDNFMDPRARGSVIVGGGAAYDPVFGAVPNRILGTNVYEFIGGGLGNSSSGGRNVIGGGQENTMSDANGSVIGGGVHNLITAPVDAGAIVGGSHNTVTGSVNTNYPSGDTAFIGAGHDNLATNSAAFIGAGGTNVAGGAYSVVVGGYGNIVVGSHAAAGGGSFNTASGTNSAIPGGRANVAAGLTSFAAGNRAKALQDGSYVWSDSQSADFASTAANQYLIRAAGGVGIGTSTPVMQLHVQGDTRVTGVFRSGSETGTSQVPNPAGLVVRRINSTSAAVGQVVARNDHVTLERDGSNGGMIIRYPAGVRQAIACTAMTSAGTQISYYTALTGSGGGSVSIFSGATNVVQFHCTFGDSYNLGHHTEVNMIRDGTDFYWVGTLNSTYNQ